MKTKLRTVLPAVMFCVAAFFMTSFVYADAGTSGDYALPPDGSGTPAVDQPVETLIPEERPTETPEPEITPTPAESDPPEEGNGEENGGFDFSDLLTGIGDLFGSFTPEQGSFTPEGNLSLIDDFLFSATGEDGEKEEKQFITVESKNGNYFFIVIDRAGDEENVYFLNMVDEADLFALMDEPEAEEGPAPAVCTCDDKCYAGHVDTTCQICAVNMTACAGKEPEPEPTPEPETEPEQKSSVAGTVTVIVLILAVAGGAAYYFLKMRGSKPKPQTEGDDDLDEYDFGAEDEEQMDKYVDFPRSGEDSEPDAPDPDDKAYWPDSGGYGPDSEEESPK